MTEDVWFAQVEDKETDPVQHRQTNQPLALDDPLG